MFSFDSLSAVFFCFQGNICFVLSFLLDFLMVIVRLCLIFCCFERHISRLPYNKPLILSLFDTFFRIAIFLQMLPVCYR